MQSLFTSRASLISAALFSAGSIAWYTHLYGSLPFVGEVHANSLADDGLHPAAYPWSHKGLFDSFDHSRYVRVDYREISSDTCTLASVAVSRFIRRFVLHVTRSTVLPGATLSGCPILPTKRVYSPRM